MGEPPDGADPPCHCECPPGGTDEARQRQDLGGPATDDRGWLAADDRGWLTADDRSRFAADDRGRMERRDLAKVLATIGGLTAVGSLGAPLVSLTQVFEREYTGPIYADGVPLVDAEGERVGENRLGMGEFLTVFPETRPGVEQAPTLLVRFPEQRYGGETNLASTVSGYAAYSKVCTHAGCMVSDVEDTTLVCPCHYGKFDPLVGAVVVGGPPPRPLPQLPITLSADGYLVATGDFEAPVGVAEG